MRKEKLPDEIPSVTTDPKRISARVVRMLFPSATVLVLLTLPLLAAYAAYLINLRSKPEEVAYWSHLASPLTLVGALVLLLLLLFWMLCSRAEVWVRHSRFHRIPLGAVAALAVVVVFGFLFQSGRAQWFFLEAVKVRAAQYSYPRSVTFWKRDAMDERIGGNNKVILVGSSQVNLGTDSALIAKRLGEAQVSKYALPGFGIMQYLMVAPSLIRMKPKAVVCWLSEFDTFREDRIPSSRLRAFSSIRQFRQLVSALQPIQLWENRSELMDVLMGALTPVWQDRDLMRVLAFDYWWPAHIVMHAPQPVWHAALQSPTNNMLASDIRHMKKSIRRTNLLDENFRSYRLFAQMLVRHGIRLYVFEGESNPVAMAGYDPDGRMRREDRARFEAMASQIGFAYIPASQIPHFTAADYRDVYHLKPDAAKRFSIYLASYLKGQGL